jgi:uncharacterized HAD superfamily protein
VTHGHKAGLRIAVDVDGVLFDHVPHVVRGFRDRHGIDLMAEGLRHWDFYRYEAVRDANLPLGSVEALLRGLESDERLHRLPPRDSGALKVMGRWMDEGHRVSVVTARDRRSEAATRLFLRHNGIPHHDLHMEVVVKTGWDVLVDDAPHNVLAAAAEGSLALLMDQPYNREVVADGNPLRVHDWRQIEAAVRAVAQDTVAPLPIPALARLREPHGRKPSGHNPS